MGRRRLTADERELWHGITRSVAPLPKRRAAPDDAAPETPPKPKPSVKPPPRPAAPAAVAPPRAVPKPAAAPLGRKARRRIARGSDSIDARLDLHGLTQAEAHGALLQFLRRAHSGGARMVLVITGKGGGAQDGRGVLRRQVPMWLRLPEFAEFIVGFETAAIAHGGEGAMYVRLRRANG
jgi:DNA-nicking Smr family endonuclease